ncbi:MAG TPA: vWA domain-containing protein [Kofleriaceae bacterium]|jgi:hypothetical protein
MRIQMGLAVLLACGSLAACGGSNNGGNGDDSQSDAGTPGDGDQPLTQCTTNADCNPDQRCDTTTSTCVGGCGANPLSLAYVPANFGLVLDRSCSMTQTLTGTNTTKWGAAVAAIDHAVDLHDADVRWGLTLFPDTTNDSCSQDAAAYPIGAGNGAGIRSLLQSALQSNDANFPDGPCVTNIDTGIEAAAADPALQDSTRKSYLMLITDGSQSSCNVGGGNTGTQNAIGALATAGVPTFVVGFGSEVNATQLNKFATAGGTALTGTTKYYQADNAAQLDTVFQQISGLVVSCSYTIDPAPADLGLTWVYFGTDLVPRDTTQAAGWDYDAATHQMTFYGSYCDSLTTHTVTDVDVLYGCPTPPIL